MVKLWVDDLRPAPRGYDWARSVNDAKIYLQTYQGMVEVIDLDHDAGDFAKNGGDFIQLLNWLELPENRKYLPTKGFAIHTMNPVGAQNMRGILNTNEWREVY